MNRVRISKKNLIFFFEQKTFIHILLKLICFHLIIIILIYYLYIIEIDFFYVILLMIKCFIKYHTTTQFTYGQQLMGNIFKFLHILLHTFFN